MLSINGTCLGAHGCLSTITKQQSSSSKPSNHGWPSPPSVESLKLRSDFPTTIAPCAASEESSPARPSRMMAQRAVSLSPLAVLQDETLVIQRCGIRQKSVVTKFPSNNDVYLMINKWSIHGELAIYWWSIMVSCLWMVDNCSRKISSHGCPWFSGMFQPMKN